MDMMETSTFSLLMNLQFLSLLLATTTLTLLLGNIYWVWVIGYYFLHSDLLGKRIPSYNYTHDLILTSLSISESLCVWIYISLIHIFLFMYHWISLYICTFPLTSISLSLSNLFLWHFDIYAFVTSHLSVKGFYNSSGWCLFVRY